jgi:hypothetical protein
VIAFASGGVGHGNYGLFVLLFPFASIAAVALDHLLNSTAPMILVAVLQFPCYGLLLGFAITKRRVTGFVIGIFGAHALFVLLAFWLAR